MLICKICKSKKLIKKFEYLKKPKKETLYSKINYKKYHRFYYKCQNCDHYSGYYKMSISNLYSSTYNDSLYSGKLKKNFDKIKNLPPLQTDNFFRAERVDKFINKNNLKDKNLKVLDIGTGLGIFPYSMKKKGYSVTGIDPDKRSCSHLRKNLKIRAIHGNFLKLKIKKKFDLVTLNKVIEHIANPKLMLSKVKKILNKNGHLYIEVPDIAAAKLGKNREEFHLDHLHVFSKSSLLYLSRQLKLKKLNIKSIKEPSGKFTIFGFFKK